MVPRPDKSSAPGQLQFDVPRSVFVGEKPNILQFPERTNVVPRDRGREPRETVHREQHQRIQFRLGVGAGGHVAVQGSCRAHMSHRQGHIPTNGSHTSHRHRYSLTRIGRVGLIDSARSELGKNK